MIERESYAEYSILRERDQARAEADRLAEALELLKRHVGTAGLSIIQRALAGRASGEEAIKEDCMEIPTQFEPSDNPYGEEDAVLYTAQRQELENLRKLVIASLDAAEPECHGPIQGFWIPAGYFDALRVAVHKE